MKITKTTGKFDEDYWCDSSFGISLETDSYNNSFAIGNLTECPEDATLGRDLSFAYDVFEMLIAAYKAGKNGEELSIIENNESEEE